MYDWAMNQVKAARAKATLDNKVKAGLIKEYSEEDLKAEYASYHGVFKTPEFEAQQEVKAQKIGKKPKTK